MIKQYSSFLYLLSTDMMIKGLNLFLIIYFARHLSIIDFGLLSLLLTYFTYFLVMIEFGTSHLALKEIINLNEYKKSEFITNTIFLKFLLSFISILLFNVLFFNKLSMSILLSFSILLVLSSFISDWYFKSLYKNNLLFKSYFYALIGYVYIFLISNESIFDYFFVRILLLSISIGFMIYFLVKDSMINYRLISLEFIKIKILKNSFPLFISTVAVTIYYNIDVIMLNIYKGSYDVGIYSAYYKFVFVFLTFKAVIVGYMTSKLSYMYANKKYENLINLVKKITIYVFVCVAFCLIIIFNFYEVIIHNSFGDKYLVEGSQHLLVVLLLTVLITYLYLILPTIQIIIGNQKNFMYFTLYAATINILSNLYFIPLYGFVGAAYSTLISEILLLMLFLNSYMKFKKGLI
jgi:O-antigen/teichoic acid export membrane protein